MTIPARTTLVDWFDLFGGYDPHTEPVAVTTAELDATCVRGW